MNQMKPFYILTIVCFLSFALCSVSVAADTGSGWFVDFASRIEAERAKIKDLQGVVATAQVSGAKPLDREKRLADAASTIANAIIEKYTEHVSQEEMRYILTETKIKNLLLAKDPSAYIAKTLRCPVSKKGLAGYGKVISKLQAKGRLEIARQHLNDQALELSIKNLMKKHPDSYPNGKQFLTQISVLKKQPQNDETLRQRISLRRRALVDANPLLKGKKLLAIRRRDHGLAWKSSWNNDYPANWQGLSSLKKRSKIAQVVTLPIGSSGTEKEKILYTHDNWIGRMDLHFDAEKVLFTSLKAKGEKDGNWNIYELALKDKTVKSVTSMMPADTDSYDACYTADDRIVFVNSSGYQGVPCVGGYDYVGNLHLLDRKSGKVRRLCFDQDNNWHPTLLANGRILFLRWEYTDSAHYFSRILMHMNPDGTDQKEYYGSNSYWPNSLFYAKPVPGSSSRFFGIVTGHHGVRRAGEIFKFDVNKGRKEAAGVIQELPGYKKPVDTPIIDQLADRPNRGDPIRFAETRPLSEDYVLVTRENGGIYLVDIFDNIVPIKLSDAYSYCEPIVLAKTTRPRAIPDRAIEGEKEATAFISDIYKGRSMQGVPRGSVKSIRVFRYEYCPRNMGSHYAMGMESGWDVKVILGTVPVEKDGSAMFKIPANSPISLQPLDENGQALQLMRSWLTAMPGEVISCIGCHESQNDAPPSHRAKAAMKPAVKITPWKGKPRGFGFLQEVQPVLDKYCLGCHDGTKKGRPDFSDTKIDMSPANRRNGGGSNSYYSLHPYVRRNGPEGDYTGLAPLEFHADTSELIHLLKKGHHGVKLDADAMDRLVTWIDLNAPFKNSWSHPSLKRSEIGAVHMKRRYDLRKMYAGYKGDYETPLKGFEYKRTEKFIKPKPVKKAEPVKVNGFPLKLIGEIEKQTIKLADGVTMDLVKIPGGAFAMGSVNETPAEQPMASVKVDKPFWMGVTEVSLEQYRLFEKAHKNGYYDMHFKDQVNPGYNMDKNKNYPAIRVSWEKAMAFCKWLSKKTGRKVSLPTEAQWEWAARAGSDKDLFFGDTKADFAAFANLADKTMIELAVMGVDPKPIKNPIHYKNYELKVTHVDDGVLHLADVNSYKPNPFGLKNIIGNVAEWTRSEYRPYPYADNDGRNKTDATGRYRTVRGGSWHDRPRRATSSWRWRYPQWQRVYNVGFRIVIQ
jgi:formylglycine-generating enzyme required for sulfatase activity